MTIDFVVKTSIPCLLKMVMANVQTLLENADTPDLLKSVINVILHIAKVYQHVFNAHFRVSIKNEIYKD